jgi:ClpP class serine protease
MYSAFLASIIKSDWLISSTWVQANTPLIMEVMKGNGDARLFGMQAYKDDDGPGNDSELRTQEARANAMQAGMQQTAFFVSPYFNNKDISALGANAIAIVKLHGPLLASGGMCSYGIKDYSALVTRLAAANNITGILFDMNGPGGNIPVELVSAIKTARASKPVYGVVNGGMAASAHMWVLAAVEKAFVTEKTDEVGCVGVYTTIANWNEYYKSQGLPVVDVYAPQSTEKNLDYRKANEGDTSLIEERLGVLAAEFINSIKSDRGTRLTSNDWQTGKMYFAKEAKAMGLIDGIKSYNDVLTELAKVASIKTKSNQQNSNTMAFEKTMGAAKATQFAVVDEGFALTEAQLNNVEAAIIAGEQAAAALDTATETIKEFNTKWQQLNETATASANTINTLTAELETLRGKASTQGGSNVATSAENEAAAAGGGKVASWLDPNNPINAWADSKLPKTEKAS